MLYQRPIRLNTFPRHFRHDVLGALLDWNNDDIHRRGFECISTLNFLSCARNKGANFFRVGIRHQREAFGVGAEMMNECRRFAGATPGGSR